ncbi:citrate lyase acyl carrier protein [Marinilabiliaceae bacterium JC017]|nr:citrate lyase acyl carrier protein [Marinilabiliaceae bacterium JC017]
MILKEKAQAGTFESSDILIMVEPLEAGAGRKIELKSIVMQQYGDDILQQLHRELDALGVQDVRIIANDKGALALTISARLETAIKRSAGIKAS